LREIPVTFVANVAVLALPVMLELMVAGSLASLMVPLEMLVAFNDVRLAPLPLKVVADSVPVDD
jgi:hypothetical protein